MSPIKYPHGIDQGGRLHGGESSGCDDCLGQRAKAQDKAGGVADSGNGALGVARGWQVTEPKSFLDETEIHELSGQAVLAKQHA